jgi:phosphoglucomutase
VQVVTLVQYQRFKTQAEAVELAAVDLVLQEVQEAVDLQVTCLILDLHHNLFTQHHQEHMPVAVEEVKIIEEVLPLQDQVVMAAAETADKDRELQDQLVQPIQVAEVEEPHVVLVAVELVDQELF